MKYHIEVDGCDASTEIILDMTDEQLAFANYLANCIKQTSYSGCMPRMNIKPLDEHIKYLKELWEDNELSEDVEEFASFVALQGDM